MVVLLLKNPILDPMDPDNYCTVSNLLFLGKDIERAADKYLQKLLYDTLAPDPFQAGLYPGHGMEMALVVLLNDLHRQLD